MSEIERREESPQPVEWVGDERQPFDRLDGETSYEHMLFTTYRDLLAERSQKKVAEKLGLSHNEVAKLAQRQSWVARAQAFDDHVDRMARRALERDIIKSRQEVANTAMLMRQKVAVGLAALDATQMTPKDLVYALDVATKLERAARGDLETKRVEITGDGGGPVKIVGEMSAAERAQMLADVQAQINARLGIEAASEIIEGEIVAD